MSGTDRPEVDAAGYRVHELLAENDELRLEVARLGGQLEAINARVGAQDAADEHRRVELEVALRELGDVRAELREAHVRVDEWRRRLSDTREQLAQAERQRDEAVQERAAVIAALGRRARREIEKLASPDP